MKKTLQITTLFFIIILVALNSLFAFVLFYNRSYVQSHKTELFIKKNYFDIETKLLFKNTAYITWMDEEEIEIAGNYFDVLKITDLGKGLSRIYVYEDDLESTISKDSAFEKDHSAKKNHRSVFSDLLKLKSYNKQHHLETFLCAQDMIYKALFLNTQEGYFKLPYHPPTA